MVDVTDKAEGGTKRAVSEQNADLKPAECTSPSGNFERYREERQESAQGRSEKTATSRQEGARTWRVICFPPSHDTSAIEL